MEQREPRGVLPTATQQDQVESPVVVEIGLRGVDGQGLPGEAGRSGAVLERAVAAIDEERGPPVGLERGGEDIGSIVAGEVVEHAPAGHVRPALVEPDLGRDVLEPAHIQPRPEGFERDQPVRGDLLGVFAERHVSEVQQPSDTQVIRALAEIGREMVDGRA